MQIVLIQTCWCLCCSCSCWSLVWRYKKGSTSRWYVHKHLNKLLIYFSIYPLVQPCSALVLTDVKEKLFAGAGPCPELDPEELCAFTDLHGPLRLLLSFQVHPVIQLTSVKSLMIEAEHSLKLPKQVNIIITCIEVGGVKSSNDTVGFHFLPHWPWCVISAYLFALYRRQTQRHWVRIGVLM